MDRNLCKTSFMKEIIEKAASLYLMYLIRLILNLYRNQSLLGDMDSNHDNQLQRLRSCH